MLRVDCSLALEHDATSLLRLSLGLVSQFRIQTAQLVYLMSAEKTVSQRRDGLTE